MNLFKTFFAIATLIAFTSPHTAMALKEDRNQAITILSDSAERDEAKGTTIYSGSVLMEQGSMRIEAQKVIIYNIKNKVTKIIATGSPVRYQQKPNKDEAMIIAQANTLEYNIAKDTLHLIEDAFLQQEEGTSISGQRIDYDVKKSVVKAGSNTSQNERVKMVIPANALKQDNEQKEDK